MTTDTLTTREAVRRASLHSLVTRCETAAVPMEGGPMDGISVVSIGTLKEQVRDELEERLGPPSDKVAEVTTPATVNVSAICPECDLPMLIVVSLLPTLTVDGDGAEISVKAKSKSRVHVHGQLSLPEEAEGQMTIEDMVGPVPTVDELVGQLSHVLPDDLAEMPAPEALEAWSDLDKREVMEWATKTLLAAEAEADDLLPMPPPRRPVVIGGTPVVESEGTGEPPTEVEGDTVTADPCPFPECLLEVDHRGKHKFPPGVGETE